jgi:basic membrane protein A
MSKSKVSTFILVVLLLTTMLVTAQARAADPEGFKVTFLMADSPQDNGWNNAHYRGIQQLKTLGEVIEDTPNAFKVKLSDGRVLEVQMVEKVGYAPADIDRFGEKAVKDGANMVFGTWWDSGPSLKMLSDKYPDVLFEHCSGYPVIQSNGRNLSTYFIKQEQGDFVAGYVVGRMGYNKVGLVGTFPIPEPVRGINGFTLGLQRGLREGGIDPKSAVVRVVWVNSWLDAQEERMAAEGLIAEGYSMIRQMGDTPYASQAACQEPGVLAIGYGTDVSPSASCSIVTNEWNWGQYYVTRVQEALNNTWKSQDWWGGFEADAVKMAGWNDKLVAADIRQAAEKIVADIKGGFEPFCGPISGTGLGPDGKEVRVEVPQGKCLSDMDLLTMQWFVDGVKGEYPPTPPQGFTLELKDAR